ncbi:MAG: hypothetical protein GTN76_09245 [Candidatus Aenigmarchaeota archaeon]|nr:hypothetical protein [Candidatus Aenigmarchaeota archaeon]
MVVDKITLPSAIAPQPRLYTLILGESADDRKSTAIKLTVNFFTDALKDFPACWGVGSAEGLADQFQGQKKLLLVFDEFKTFVSKCKIESSILLQATNSLFELNRYQSVTKKHSINLKDVYLSMLGASTVESYEAVFDHHFHAIGFYNRLFIVRDTGRPKWSIPPKMEIPEKETLKRQLADILKIVNEAADSGIVEIPLTAEAGEMFDEWYFNVPRTEVAKRLDTYGHRLMLLLAINQGKVAIDADIMGKVITLLDYQYRIREETDPIDADNQIAQLEGRICRILKGGPKNITELKRGTNYSRFGLWMFHTALNNLMRYGMVNQDKKTGLYYQTEGKCLPKNASGFASVQNRG